jgi:hypothetical protein
MRIPAERFLSLRAFGAPAVVVSLALQGIFRGFKDTKTPVFCLGKCLISLLIFSLNLDLICGTLTVWRAREILMMNALNDIVTCSISFFLLSQQLI